MHYLALILEWIFFIGLAGSLLVAIMAFVGDLHVFFDKDEEPARASAPMSHSPAGADD
jgi:uncharacterized iron-regulated membrane protein